MSTEINATALWKWARAYAARAVAAEKGTVYPTFREATKRFRCSLDDVENVIGDDIEDVDVPEPYLGIGVGFGVNGGGVHWFEARGEYVVEAY